MYERFTDGAREVMMRATMEAKEYKHGYIGTEHILLAIIKRCGYAAGILSRLNCVLLSMTADIKKLIQVGAEAHGERKLPQTPAARAVVQFAMEEACAQNVNYVGEEHLLIGLIRESDGIAAQVLTQHGVTLINIREAVSKGNTLGGPHTTITILLTADQVIQVGLIFDAICLACGMSGAEVGSVCQAFARPGVPHDKLTELVGLVHDCQIALTES